MTTGRSRPGSGRAIVRVVAMGASGLAGAWVFAFGAAYGFDLPAWVPATAALAVVGVVGFTWLLTKVAHGGDWALRQCGARESCRRGTVDRPAHEKSAA